MSNRRADMSINIIIVAVIALLVLIVLSYLFVGKMATFRRGVDRCEEVAGASCKAMCESNERALTDKQCDNNGNGEYNEGALTDGICCLSL